MTDFELIIVDDGSQDGSVPVIESYAAKDNRIQLLRHSENQGAAAARNTGLFAARGKYWTGMDCDDISQPQRLRRQVDSLQANPSIGAVSVWADVVAEDLRFLRAREPPNQHANIMLEFVVGSPFIHAVVMTERRLILAAGGYDERLRICDDTDLMARCMGGLRFANIPESLYLIRRRPGQLTFEMTPERAEERRIVHMRVYGLLFGEAAPKIYARMKPLRAAHTWRARRLLQRDLEYLCDALLAKAWIEESDLPLLQTAIERKLAQVKRLSYKGRRLWQMFRHWLRHRFGSRNSDWET